MTSAPPVPPWDKHPDIPRYAIGWRMGDGEAYLHSVWGAWADGQTRDELVEYFEQYPPPVEWADFVAGCLYPDVDDDDAERAVKMLVHEFGWVDFDEWLAWFTAE